MGLIPPPGITVQDVLRIKCPTCGAAKGVPCLGGKEYGNHIARYDKAIELRKFR